MSIGSPGVWSRTTLSNCESGGGASWALATDGSASAATKTALRHDSLILPIIFLPFLG